MPRKPKREKQTITVIKDGKPIKATLHPPRGRKTSWYAYWKGLTTKKSTGCTELDEAILVVEDMIKSGGKRAELQDILMTDEEFFEIQRVHFSRKQEPDEQTRAQKSLAACLQAIQAFKEVTGLDPITLATPDDCARFERKALALAKNWRRQFPKSKKDASALSPSTIKKWSGALRAAFERANRNSGKKCVRGVVHEKKLLTENPWRQFSGIQGRKKPIRQFDDGELLNVLDYFATKWPLVTVAGLVAKVYLWSWGRRSEVASLRWDKLRQIGDEYHFEIIGKRGVKKWFRIPEGLHAELIRIKLDSSPYVFAAYTEQLRRHYEGSDRPGPRENIIEEFKPVNLGEWFYRRLVDWSKTSPKGHAYSHVFRKTSLQYARTGEDVNREVAADAKLGEAVMMTHYVQESDVQMRHASNRTFRRIQASLSIGVAGRYGCVQPVATELEEKLQRAIGAKDWELVKKLSAELAVAQPPKAG